MTLVAFSGLKIMGGLTARRHIASNFKSRAFPAMPLEEVFRTEQLAPIYAARAS
jgi:hypothetical protein